jgi:hypothetical protein
MNALPLPRNLTDAVGNEDPVLAEVARVIAP